MSTAREVVAQAIREWDNDDDLPAPENLYGSGADAVLAALKEAGYIVLDPTGGTVEPSPDS